MEINSALFVLPTGKTNSSVVEAQKAVATAVNIQKPQTWQAAIPKMTVGWPQDVPAKPVPPRYVPARATDLRAVGIGPRFSVAAPLRALPGAPAQRPVSVVTTPSLPLAPTAMTPPSAIPAVMTTTSSSCAPMAVVASTRPGWPAPPVEQALAITTPGKQTLPVTRTTAGAVVGASIFGGPITVGDPEVGLLHLNPYTEIEELPATTARPAGALVKPATPAAEPLNKGEGWTDVFGISHGYKVPAARQMSFGRGAFNIQAPLSAFRGLGRSRSLGDAASGEPVTGTTAFVLGAVLTMGLPFALGYYMGKAKR